MSIAMMTAFWVGTLPLLSVAAWGWSSVSPRWQVFAQPFAAGCIISFGIFILFQRSLIDLSSLAANTGSGSSSIRNTLEMVRSVGEKELPCCGVENAKNP
jgi:sulfite exporter TauE/SafE